MAHIKNPRFYPPIYRKLRTTRRTLSGADDWGKKRESSSLMYAPTPTSQIPSIPIGEKVKLVDIPDVDCEINFVVVEYGGKRYNVMQDDLRFDYD